MSDRQVILFSELILERHLILMAQKDLHFTMKAGSNDDPALLRSGSLNYLHGASWFWTFSSPCLLWRQVICLYQEQACHTQPPRHTLGEEDGKAMLLVMTEAQIGHLSLGEHVEFTGRSHYLIGLCISWWQSGSYLMAYSPLSPQNSLLISRCFTFGHCVRIE